MTATFTIDDRELKVYLAKFTPAETEKLLRKATTAGATQARNVLTGEAPIGTSRREGQFYRRVGAGHGSFQSSMAAKPIRRRGYQARTVASIIGPMGQFGFVRSWREQGTKPHGKHPGSAGTHWLERAAPLALGAARVASEAILERYGATKT